MKLSEQYFSYIRRLMIVAGIWNIERKSKKKFYTVYSIIMQTVYASQIISYSLDVPSLLKSNQTEAFSNIGVIIFFAIIITKMLMCQSQPIVKLLRIAIKPDFPAVKDLNVEVKAIYKKQTKLNNFLITIVIGSMTIVTVSFAVFGDFNCYKYFKQYSNATDKPILLNYWYPFDTNKYYAVVLVDQHIRLTLGAFGIATVNAFVICIIIFVRLQLQLLQYGFRNFDKLTRHKNNAEGASVLKQLCQKHLDLIGFIADLNQSFSVIVFIEYMISSITFAAQILQIIDGGEKLLFACGTLFYTIMQLLIFSWSSNEIIVQSKELATALFESNWYDYDKAIKVMAHIMIMRCQKPLSLTIGRFGVMNLDVGVSRKLCTINAVVICSLRGVVANMTLSEKYFSYIRRLMIVVGIWNIEKEISQSKKKFYAVYSIIMQTVCASPIVSYTLDVPSLLKSNQTEAFSIIGVIIFFAIIITKMLMCQSQSIVNLIRIAVQPNFQAVKDLNVEVEAIYKKQTRLNNYLITIVIGSMTILVVSVSVFGDFTCYMYFKQYSNATDKPMLQNYWYPFDTNKYYALVLVEQHIRVTLSAFCIATVNAFVICIIIFARLQLKLLQYGFRNFDKLTRHKNSAEGASVLKQLYQKHLDLIGFIADLNQSFSFIIFIEYMISSITFAAQILQIIDGGEKLLFACGALFYTIIQLLIFSWSSNEIIIQSKELATALFESNWYDYDKEIKVMAHIMIMRCQKPLSLTIGRFGVMDLDVGVSRLKLAYSYTSVMTSGD
ncbi:uncharacterized protein LOC132701321 isoform X2 [Cylas formicarius]|uniref:uncharacterized protein LOC132701321 isoform X2 n=1 Tax=Cylas formicarius TaxID=197179 RepID=UPI002958DA97|nr:uncharacterized protein LOC132701321 isoform X2 [Cylas formicarius]